jgi:hypothetical protein
LRRRERERKREGGSQVVLKSENKMDRFEHYKAEWMCTIEILSHCRRYILPVQSYVEE